MTQHSEQQLWEMAHDKSWPARADAAENPASPELLLRYLASDGNALVRASLARNPSCPKDLLRHLANDEDYNVRTSIAKNPTSPEDLLRQMACDKKGIVRVIVAKNPACPEDLLRQLAADKEAKVRASVAQNPTSPPDVVLSCLLCWGLGDERAQEVQTAFDVHKDKLLAFAHSGLLDFEMTCVRGETLKDGLINGGQVEIYNLLMAEQLAGKAERLVDIEFTTQNPPSRRI